MASQRNLIEAVRAVGTSPLERARWLVAFAQYFDDASDPGTYRASRLLLEPSPENALAELGVFIATAASDRDPAAPVAREIAATFKSELRLMLKSLADHRFALAPISTPYLVRIDYGSDGESRRKYVGENVLTAAWLAALDLLARPDVEILRCHYQHCKRGYNGRHRLFIRSRHSLYCSQTCGNNAASDNFLARFIKLEARKKRSARKRKEQP
jgi:hypothetical protein